MVTARTQRPERDTEGRTGEPAIVSLARQRLESHPHFHHHCETVRIVWVEKQGLVMSGRLPSFHLKQLAQEALRGLNVTVINRIEVVCPDGLSSVQQATRPEPRNPR